MNSIVSNPATKLPYWVALIMCSAMFLGFVAVVFMNIPPFVKSDHISANWNMLFIASFGAVASIILLAAVMVFRLSKHMGRVPVGIICAEASATFILSIALLYKSLNFFGLV